MLSAQERLQIANPCLRNHADRDPADLEHCVPRP
jgi:hypothetical protein